MDEKKKEKYLQTKYKRELERYLNRLVNFAQQESNSSKEALESFIEKIASKFHEVEKVSLYNPYFESIESFVEKTGRLVGSDRECDDIKAEIVHDANQIRKQKRKKTYNRKEKNRDFDHEF
ncbi:hypothetical protein [Hydrogenimonas sp.]